jgi:hypothetical protein
MTALTIPEQLVQAYRLRREVSQTTDLAVLLLARLCYAPQARQPGAVTGFVRRLDAAAADGAPLNGVSGHGSAEFARFLSDYLVINRTAKGTTLLPMHPALTLATNGEGPRVEGFIAALAGQFTPAEAEALRQRLWSDAAQPGFERMLRDAVAWQIGDEAVAPPPAEPWTERSVQDPPSSTRASSLHAATARQTAIVAQTKDDLLALASRTVGVEDFVVHAGRLLAFAITRFLLAADETGGDLPIYAAPAADSHPGVKALAHEIIELHRARLAEALRRDFRSAVERAAAELGHPADPAGEGAARALAGELFGGRANIVPAGEYARLREAHGAFPQVAEHYYWTHGGARNRFLRQLHATHLNLAKKCGFANSRSRYSQWHFYWLAPSLVETLMLLAEARQGADRVLLADLLAHWRAHYGIAVMIDESWATAYRHYFRGMGSPDGLNEANQRRLAEILAERGRLHKNSDDFPWVLLRL